MSNIHEFNMSSNRKKEKIIEIKKVVEGYSLGGYFCYNDLGMASYQAILSIIDNPKCRHIESLKIIYEDKLFTLVTRDIHSSKQVIITNNKGDKISINLDFTSPFESMEMGIRMQKFLS